jgi:hypothetical protein
VERFSAAQTRGRTARSTALSVGREEKGPEHVKIESAESGESVERGAGRGREAPAQVR